MDAARNSYYEDVAMRSVQKNSARHKANGSSVAKLGNKRLTNKEIAAKHGPEETYRNTDNLMTYADFMCLPDDLKIEFVNKMMDRYDISMKYISRFLFNKGDDGLRAILDKKKLLRKEMYTKKRGDSKESIERFRIEVTDWEETCRKAKETEKIQAQMRRANFPKMMTWEEFKALSGEKQIAFVNKVIEYYQISPAIIAEELFGIRATSLYHHLKKNGTTGQLKGVPLKVSRDKDLMNENTRKFRSYISAWKDFNDVEAKEPKDSKIIEPQPILEAKKAEEAKPAEKKEEPKKLPDDSEFELEKKLPELLSPNNTFTNEFREKLQEVEKRINKVMEEKGIVTGSDLQKALESDAINPEVRVIDIACDVPYAGEEYDAPKIGLVAGLEKKPEPNPMDYHEMHFSVNYIAEEIDMDEIYAIASLVKRHKKPGKRVKVNFEFTEV